MEPEVQKQIHLEIERALNIARTLGGDYEYEIEIGYPPMINDESVVELLRQVGQDLIGDEHVSTREPRMGAEDFGFFSERVPGAMFGLGCLIDGDERFHHNPRFDVNENCLHIGAAILTEATLRFMKS
jgi:amidohydrolase